jgi:hypothetical protein
MAVLTTKPVGATKPDVRSARPGHVYYFTYGANMDMKVVTRRGLKPKTSEPATLHSHKLVFNAIGGIALL